jgi:NAD(P)-dependent dehydrogenase (short-subunit alcohol dehydrogenase family)
VFGAGRSIGGAVAKQFSSEGAEVFLAGRTGANVREEVRVVAATAR